jgi:hypothetical protein
LGGLRHFEFLQSSPLAQKTDSPSDLGPLAERRLAANKAGILAKARLKYASFDTVFVSPAAFLYRTRSFARDIDENFRRCLFFRCETHHVPE